MSVMSITKFLPLTVREKDPRMSMKMRLRNSLRGFSRSCEALFTVFSGFVDSILSACNAASSFSVEIIRNV